MNYGRCFTTISKGLAAAAATMVLAAGSLCARQETLLHTFINRSDGSAPRARSSTPTPAGLAPVQTVVFKDSASSSGWIDFTPLTNFGIYLPVKVNGHDVMAVP